MVTTLKITFDMEVETWTDEITNRKEFSKEWYAMRKEVLDDIIKDIKTADGRNGALEITFKPHSLTCSNIISIIY